MKTFIKRVLFCSLPICFVIICTIVVDPYYLLFKGREFNQTKFDIGYSYDQGHRYKLFTFLNSPKPNIILGASEINPIHERNIPEDGWHSLSFGGAKLEESIDLFWKISKENQLKKVIFAPEFIKFYNAIIDEDILRYSWESTQSSMSFDIFDDKCKYIVDEYTIKTSFYFILDKLGVTSTRNKPQTSKDLFWKTQLDYAKVQYSKPVREEKKVQIYSQFKDIADYCNSHNILVQIVLPIQHVDLISLEYADDIYPLYRDYLNHLIAYFGAIYYFDYPNEYSSNDNLFSDPFHYVSSDIYLNNIWETKDSGLMILTDEESLNKLDHIRQNYLN